MSLRNSSQTALMPPVFLHPSGAYSPAATRPCLGALSLPCTLQSVYGNRLRSALPLAHRELVRCTIPVADGCSEDPWGSVEQPGHWRYFFAGVPPSLPVLRNSGRNLMTSARSSINRPTASSVASS